MCTICEYTCMWIWQDGSRGVYSRTLIVPGVVHHQRPLAVVHHQCPLPVVHHQCLLARHLQRATGHTPCRGHSSSACERTQAVVSWGSQGSSQPVVPVTHNVTWHFMTLVSSQVTQHITRHLMTLASSQSYRTSHDTCVITIAQHITWHFMTLVSPVTQHNKWHFMTPVSSVTQHTTWHVHDTSVITVTQHITRHFMTLMSSQSHSTIHDSLWHQCHLSHSTPHVTSMTLVPSQSHSTSHDTSWH